MHLALVGAFPFPYPQGSQVFFGEEARSLQAAGVRVTLVCYGQGEGAVPRDLALIRAPLSPRKLTSGPSRAKPFADLALAATLVRAHRRTPFDAVLAHNAEGALAALLARSAMRRPVVYVAHTVLARELETYAPPRFANALQRIGAALDRNIARRSDAVIALARAGERTLAPHARGPVRRIPPALAASPPPKPDEIAAACAQRGLEVGRYALYAGNLDGYQDLPALATAARAIAVPVVAATHSPHCAPEPLRTVRVADAEEMRLLTFGAGVALLARSAPGGFPIKLLNYMEASRAIIARAAVADPLEQDRSGVLLTQDAPPSAWVAAVNGVLGDPARAARLGAEARCVLERDHDPAARARDVLALVETTCVNRATTARTW